MLGGVGVIVSVFQCRAWTAVRGPPRIRGMVWPKMIAPPQYPAAETCSFSPPHSSWVSGDPSFCITIYLFVVAAPSQRPSGVGRKQAELQWVPPCPAPKWPPRPLWPLGWGGGRGWRAPAGGGERERETAPHFPGSHLPRVPLLPPLGSPGSAPRPSAPRGSRRPPGSVRWGGEGQGGRGEQGPHQSDPETQPPHLPQGDGLLDAAPTPYWIKGRGLQQSSLLAALRGRTGRLDGEYQPPPHTRPRLPVPSPQIHPTLPRGDSLCGSAEASQRGEKPPFLLFLAPRRPLLPAGLFIYLRW